MGHSEVSRETQTLIRKHREEAGPGREPPAGDPSGEAGGRRPGGEAEYVALGIQPPFLGGRAAAPDVVGPSG